MATSATRLRIAGFAALAAAVAGLAAGCGGSGPKSGVAGARHVLGSATVKTRKINKLGVVLVNSRGFTLYMFKPDRQRRVTCKGSCAAAWPPLKLKTGQTPTAGGAARQRLLGSDRNPGGGRVVTYNRWPLYTYIADRHLQPLAALHVHRGLEARPGKRAGHRPQRRSLVRPLALGQDHQDEAP